MANDSQYHFDSPKTIVARPNPATTMPAIMPILAEGNHLMAGGVAEALGRLISLTLRLPSHLSAQRRLEEVISQLTRIGGGQPTGFGPAKTLSLPDALARTLAEHTGQVKPASGLPPGGGEARKRIGDLCKECGQATFVYEEGCKKCLSCGFNEC